MEYRKLGGLEVSPICLGAWLFGRQTPEQVAGRMINTARDSGINFIDTADVYAGSESERILGKRLAKDRDRWVLATKVGEVTADAPNRRGLGRKWLMEEIDTSLRRLKTDYVDIYYLHMPDDATPMAETLGALHDIMRAGKVRHFGFSNYRGWQIADMVHLCDRLGVPRPIVSQPYYNILNRGIEVDVLPACAHFGIGVAVYSSLAGGLLAGKYHSRKAPPRGSRASRQDTKFSELEFRGEMFDRASKINAHARSRGMTASQFAMAWVLNNRHVTCAIAGPRTLGQWRDNLGALRHKLDADDEAFVSSLVPAGQPSTPGFIDPWFPVPARPTVSGGA